MLHGWTGSKEDFAAVAPALARGRRVVVPDLPGHGARPPADDPGGYALARQARWVLDLLDGLGVGDFDLLGHSLGGLLAQRVANLAAHRLTGLVLVGCGMGAPGDATTQQVVAVAQVARDEGLEAAWKVVTGGSDGSRDPRAAFVRQRFLGMTPEAVIGGARAVISAAPLGAFLRGIDVPVLVCHGEGDDVWLPHEQRNLAGAIPGARYVSVPDALHSPAVENPDGLLAVLTPFLDEIHRPPTGA